MRKRIKQWFLISLDWISFTVSNLQEKYDICEVCGESKVETTCAEGCGKRICYECDSGFYEDATICIECRNAITTEEIAEMYKEAIESLKEKCTCPDTGSFCSESNDSTCELTEDEHEAIKTMPALNFKKQFVQPIHGRRKKHTIRAKRKIPIKVGDKLYLYCGMRQKGAFRILPDAVKCSDVRDVIIENSGVRYDSESGDYVFTQSITVEGQLLDQDEADMLAVADGFESFNDMMKFWEGRLPFNGDIIHWKE